MPVEIPRHTGAHDDTPGAPCWAPCQNTKGEKLKPIIRCNCGRWCGIGLHHVHADGNVTASFFHAKGNNTAVGEDPNGCGWHVFIRLLDYDCGDFPPGAGR